MAKRGWHVFIDRKHLGREFDEVHAWLDHFYQSHGGFHRRFRHHREGVEEVRGMWGDEAARAAELHILLDMGHVPTQSDWAKRTSATMDATGRRAHYLDRYPVASEQCHASIYYFLKLSCEECEQVTEHCLLDVIEGSFACAACQLVRKEPDYRIE
jgi:hypothetical protein